MEILAHNEGSIVVLDGNQEQQLSVDEFVEIYGVDALPSNKPAGKVVITEERVEEMAKREEEYQEKMNKIEKYYDSFLEYLNAAGAYQHMSKFRKNFDDGVFPVQKLAYEYNHGPATIDMDVEDRNRARWKKLNYLNQTSQAVGFLPLNDSGMRKVQEFFADGDRRRYVRDNVRRLQKKGELLSIADLMRKRLRWEKIQAEKKGGNDR
ncbi:hypothetical protein IJG79_03205 [Candidatus Saccharibacteria bacterium]|nr:hypothetical protein [Candidatus Saccharibacteria bacterium]